jgi:probable rRNA maturation factor
MTDTSFVCEFSTHENLKPRPALPVERLARLTEFAEAIMQELAFKAPMSLSLHITTDGYMQHLNRTYRQMDGPTDILSFPADPLPEELLTEEIPHLGDLIMAYDYTLAQAEKSGHDPLDEFKMLIIHGILHLDGYDHDSPEAQQHMWEVQACLLEKFGIPIVVPAYVHEQTEEDAETPDDSSGVGKPTPA